MKDIFDLIIALDGLYVTSGSLYDKLTVEYENKGVIYQFNGFRERGIYIGDQPFAVANQLGLFKTYIKNNYLNTDKAFNFLSQRVRSVHESFNNVESQKIDEILKLKEKLNAEKIVILFPNLSWDCNISQKNTIFNNMEEWILETLKYCEEKNYLLIIREHPQSEKAYSVKSSVMSLMESIKSFSMKSNNLFFINGLEKVNSYKLAAKVADCSVIYSGTLIQELSFLKQKVIAVGKSPYYAKQNLLRAQFNR